MADRILINGSIHTLDILNPRASAIASLAAGHLSAGLIQAPEDVIPVYLRDKVTHQN